MYFISKLDTSHSFAAPMKLRSYCIQKLLPYRDSQMGLTLDPQLVRDLTVLITSSTAGGMVLEMLRQPVINGYFLAGSVVGPGGFKLVKVPFKVLP